MIRLESIPWLIFNEIPASQSDEVWFIQDGKLIGKITGLEDNELKKAKKDE